jgi:hypothetical protein
VPTRSAILALPTDDPFSGGGVTVWEPRVPTHSPPGSNEADADTPEGGSAMGGSSAPQRAGTKADEVEEEVTYSGRVLNIFFLSDCSPLNNVPRLALHLARLKLFSDRFRISTCCW